MVLAKGTYIIMGSAQTHKVYVGRDANEDATILPKKIVVVPDYVKAFEWQIENLPNGRYYLKSFGSPVTSVGDMLYAIVMPTGEESLEWIITPIPACGPSVYTIHNAAMTARWTLPDAKPLSQIAVRASQRLDSRTVYAPEELFVIIPDKGFAIS